MSKSTYDFVHLALLALGGEIQGKTMLQKTIYFLGIMTDHDDELGYRPHFYGPYSDDVTEAMGRLKTLGFVESSVTPWGVDSRGFEMSRTDFSLTEDGKSIARVKSEKNPEFWKEIKNAVKVLQKAGNHLDYMKLSIAAKTYFLIGKQEKPVPLREIADHARKFGWKVLPEQAREAAEYLQALGLVKLAAA